MTVRPAPQRLALVSGGETYVVPDRGELTIGRDADCGISFPSSSVSRLHARAWMQEGQLMIEDAGSRNGIFVGGALAKGPQALKLGDRVIVGDRLIVVCEGQRSELPTKPAGHRRKRQVQRATDRIETVAHAFSTMAHRALDEGKPTDAAEAFRQLCAAMVKTAADDRDATLIARTTTDLLAFAETTGDARWIETLLRLRRDLEMPLDGKTMLAAARCIESLGPCSDRSRRELVAWMTKQPLRKREREALDRLAAAKSGSG